MATTTLKLFVDTENQKVIFAEAGNHFVDFLYSIPSLPIGALFSPPVTIMNWLENSHGSLQNLAPQNMMPDYDQSMICSSKPVPTCVDALEQLFKKHIRQPISSPETSSLYYCDDYFEDCRCPYFNEIPPDANKCPYCKRCINRVTYELAKYMVMDDLVVKPMSALSFLSSDIKNIAAIEVKEIKFGIEEKLLKAALESKTVLTGVFLGNDKNV